jgi:hypothetical protein
MKSIVLYHTTGAGVEVSTKNEIDPQPFDILDYWPGGLVVSQRVPGPSATREE